MVIYSTVLNTQAKVIAIYGGTSWSQISGKFILAANSTYTVKSTGGSKDAIIPYHRHNVAKKSSVITEGKHYHNYGSSNLMIRNGGKNGANGTYYPWSGASGEHTEEATHTHDLPQHYTDYVGTDGNTTDANMPPYYAVYIWERTA